MRTHRSRNILFSSAAVLALALVGAGAGCMAAAPSPSEVAKANQLSCTAPTTMCGEACADLVHDPMNCGACGAVCARGDVCSAGACALKCSGGSTRCGDACVELRADPMNCGACGAICAPGEVCDLGACVLECSGGSTKCGDACVDVRIDPQNCGACGDVCPTPPNTITTCAAGVCSSACAPGSGDCGDDPLHRCGTDLMGDVLNCGACGNVCPTPPNTITTCAAGVCSDACAPGTADCDDNPLHHCETDLTSDPFHCGACGIACRALETCEAGVCVP